MAVVISVILAILAIGVAILPFIEERLRLQGTPPRNASLVGAKRGRDAIYDDIRTLQLEYDLGSIEEGDYRDRLRAYRVEAAKALRDQDRLEQELDRRLEEEILDARDHNNLLQDSLWCETCGRRLASDYGACADCGEE